MSQIGKICTFVNNYAKKICKTEMNARIFVSTKFDKENGYSNFGIETKQKNIMLIIISIPHQSKVTHEFFNSRQQFIDEANINATVEIPTFDRALEHYSHDLNSYILIEDREDLNSALNCPDNQHKWAEIRAEARKIQEEYF